MFGRKREKDCLLNFGCSKLLFLKLLVTQNRSFNCARKWGMMKMWGKVRPAGSHDNHVSRRRWHRNILCSRLYVLTLMYRIPRCCRGALSKRFLLHLSLLPLKIVPHTVTLPSSVRFLSSQHSIRPGKWDITPKSRQLFNNHSRMYVAPRKRNF